MQNLNDYPQVFNPEWGSPYTQELVRDIEVCRKSLNGLLFIDSVLRSVGITKPRSYPPNSEKSLHQLYRQICESTRSDHQKLSIFYYMLLDFNEYVGRQHRTNFAEVFSSRFGMSQKYAIFMKGLWYLDRRQFNLALEQLAHPSLSPEFADDIITVLAQNAENNDYSLVLAYYYAVQPVLNRPESVSSLFEAIARTSPTDALDYSRAHPDQTRQRLLEQLISSVLGGSSLGIASRAIELVSLPLEPNEEKWFQEFLTTGEGRKFRKAKDTILMRQVVTGCYAQSLNGKNLGGQWDAILGGTRSAPSCSVQV